MPSNDGLPEQRVEISLADLKGALAEWYQHHDGRTPVVPMPTLTTEEQDRIADGEPYCFRCGKPASSFSAYDDPDGVYTRVETVHNDEGTWNPATNRFACDACYIAIGMPTAPEGWRAP